MSLCLQVFALGCFAEKENISEKRGIDLPMEGDSARAEKDKGTWRN